MAETALQPAQNEAHEADIIVGLPFGFDDTVSRGNFQRRFKRHGDLPGRPYLPPEEYWLINPEKDKFEPKLDDRGLVDVDSLISDIKATIDPAYQWPTELSVDHFYWEEQRYQQAGITAVKFRDLAIHKGLVPRQWENWKHAVTLEPKVPDEDVMRARIESWAIASSLFNNIRHTEFWRNHDRRRAQRNLQAIVTPEFRGEDKIGRAVMRDIMKRHFAGVEQDLARLEAVPAEFRLVEPDDPHDVIVERLCRLLGAEALYLVAAVAAA